MEREREREKNQKTFVRNGFSVRCVDFSLCEWRERDELRERERRTGELSFEMGSLFTAQISAFANGERERGTNGEREKNQRTFVQNGFPP